MKKRDFLGRLSLFAFGCATTRAASQPQLQPQLTPIEVTPRGELLIISLVALVIIIFIIFALKDRRPKRKKKKRSS